MSYRESLENMLTFYKSQETRSYKFRREQLKKLKKSLQDREKEIYTALYDDLKKSREEAYISELGMVMSEISHLLRNLKEWMRPETVSTNLVNFPSKSILYRDPLGVILVIAPWNYPLQLSLMVVAGAIAAGNCVVLKPSELAPATAAILEKILAVFPKNYLQVIQGDGAEIVDGLMKDFRFDHIF